MTLAIVGWFSGSLSADDGEALALRDVLWQWLPEEVESVCVGPDDRMWLVTGTRETQHDFDSAKAAIAREFDKPTPRLAGIRPVLFEPGRRIWFRVEPGETLLAFDGTAWIEKTLPHGHRFTGDCLGQGGTAGGGPNLIVGHHCFFSESRGVHVFDGTTWTSKEMTDEPGHSRDPWRLMPNMEGDDVIAFTTEPKAIVWRWHLGTWSDVPSDVPNVQAACPGPDRSVWLFQAGGRIVILTDNSAKNAGEHTRDRIKNLLDATTDEERQTAIAALKECGPEGVPLAEAALETSYDPDVLAGLIAAIRGMKQGSVTRTGDLTIQKADSVVYDQVRRRIAFFASGVCRGDKQLGDGLVVVATDGAVTHHAFSSDLWNRFATSSVNPVFTADGTSVWVSGSSGHWPARLIDLDTPAVRMTAPDRRFTSVRAVRADGTVFLATDNPSKGVAAFRLGFPDDRRFLPIESVPLDRQGPALLGCDATGGVWAHLAERGLVRMHADRQEVIEKPNTNQYQRFGSMLAGSRGDVLLFSVHRFGYWKDGTLTVANDLQKLIADYRDAIADSFGAGQLPPAREVHCDIAVDDDKNIWLRPSQRGVLSVLVGTTWLSAGNALTEAGARSPAVQYLAAAGGDSVYVSDLGTIHDGGRSFFGKLRDGEPTFHEAPHSAETWRIRTQVRDHGGGLWIPANLRKSSGTSDSIGDQLAHRIADGKVESTLTNAGWPAICDPAGVVWLDQVRGNPPGTVNFWWKGAIAGTVQIPGLLSTGSAGNMPALYSDRPGSGYAWTNRGLVHLVAEPDRPAAFRIAETFSFETDTGNFSPVVCTKNGLLVGNVLHEQRGSTLGIIRLPRPGHVTSDHEKN